MSTRLPFVRLPANEQARARAMFFDARNSDGYLYELDRDGRVLCRNRSIEVVQGSCIEAARLAITGAMKENAPE